MELAPTAFAGEWSGFDQLQTELDHKFTTWTDTMEAMTAGVLDDEHVFAVVQQCAKVADIGDSKPSCGGKWEAFATPTLVTTYLTSEVVASVNPQPHPADSAIGQDLCRMGREADLVVALERASS